MTLRSHHPDKMKAQQHDPTDISLVQLPPVSFVVRRLRFPDGSDLLSIASPATVCRPRLKSPDYL